MGKVGETRAKVVSLHKQGFRRRAIAERLGISEHTVFAHLKMAGITRTKNAQSTSKLAITSRLMRGMRCSDIARELGISKQCVSQTLAGYDRAHFKIRIGGHWKTFSPETLDAAWTRVLSGELLSSIEKDFGRGISAALRRSGRYPNKTQARRVMSDVRCAEIDQRIKESGEKLIAIANELGISLAYLTNALCKWRKRNNIAPIKLRKDDPRRNGAS